MHALRSVPLNMFPVCSFAHFSSFFFPHLMQVINHTIILLRGNDLHTFNTPPPPYYKSLVSPTIIYSHWILLFTVHDLWFIFYQAPLFITISFQLPPSHLLSGSVSLPCFPFCTVSLCSHHKTSSVLHPRLSICATHLCCFTAVTEAHILIAARWGKLAAHSHACTTSLWGTHTDNAHTHMHRGILWSFAAYRWHLLGDNVVIGQLCVFVLVFFVFFGASGPLLLFPGVKWHIFQ